MDSQESPIIITRSANGFKLKANKKVKSLPKIIEVKCAYIPARGNPLKRYSIYDFDLNTDNLKKEGTDVRLLHVSGNSFLLELLSESFQFEVNGFDPERDLYIKAEIND